MSLTQRQKRHLRSLAHHLKPIVIVGAAGVTDALVEELNAALDHHELVKVRVNAQDRVARETMASELVQRTGAEQVQTIGHTLTLYRRGDSARISLP